MSDARERGYWDDYMTAYADAISYTSTSWAPWHIVPADHKWFTRLAVARVIQAKLESLNLAYPEVEPDHAQQLKKARALLKKDD